MLLLEFATGVLAFMHLAHSTPPGAREYQQQFVAHGDAGTLEADLADPARVEIHGTRAGRREHLPVPAEWWGETDPAKPYDVFEQQAAGCRAFVDAILENRPLSPNFYDGLKVQEVIDAALESHRTGCTVSLD